MAYNRQDVSLCIAICLMLTACMQSGGSKRSDILNMYELPRAHPGVAMPVDNDSYYTQPTVYKGCTQINDAPSCGGG